MDAVSNAELERNLIVDRALRLYIAILVGVFALAWATTWFNRHVRHLPYPQSSLLFNPSDRFTDWTNFSWRMAHYGESDMLSRRDVSILPYCYPLPSLYVYLGVYRLSSHEIRSYVLTTLAVFAIAALVFCLYLRPIARNWLPFSAVLLTMVCGFPLLFLVDRGNIEGYIWGIVLLGIVAYFKKYSYLAAILFALAGSMKIYPMIYLLLFVRNKQYKPIVLGIVTAAVISLGALAAVGPTIQDALHQTALAGEFLKKDQIVALNESVLRWDHSLFGIYKQAVHVVAFAMHKESPIHPRTYEASVRVYSVIAPLLFVTLYWFRIRWLPLLNQFMALTMVTLLFPYVSYDYTVVHVYTLAAVFLVYLLRDYSRAKVVPDGSAVRAIMVCFALSFTPLAFSVMSRVPGQIRGVILVVLTIMILWKPLPSSLFGDLQQDTLPVVN